MIGIALTDPTLVETGMFKLRKDLDSGAWHKQNADLQSLDEIDLGYRLVVAEA